MIKKIIVSAFFPALMAPGFSTPAVAGNETVVSGVAASAPASGQKAEKKAAAAWLKKGDWRNGFKGNADKHVNLPEFYSQYHKNKAQWDAAFKWLAETDLLSAAPGQRTIPGTTMTASVQDGKNLPLEGHWTESHRRKIDFMYVVRGIEGFGLLDHATSRPNCAYDEKKDVIHYDFDASKLTRFAVGAGNFIICFPSDWHIPLLETQFDDQTFRVIVIKIDYKE